MQFSALAAATGALLVLTPSASAQLSAYGQDFEGMMVSDGAALANDGWKIFANVFDSGGGYLYGYGTFDAPNGGPGFSAVATGSAGAAQGTKYLSIYNDYNNGDHANGNYIDALVFHEQTITAGNVGETWQMTFDFLKDPTVTNGDGDTTTFAFIKVLRSSDGSFATIDLAEFDTTNASTTTWDTATIDMVITAAMAGELLQFGYRSYATAYNDSSRLYDNVAFDVMGGTGPTLMDYEQDFESLDMADPAALTLDGWKIFANVFDAAGGYLYGYGVFDAPNGGPGFSAIATGDGGPFQMLQYVSIYSDYNNGDHANGNYIEALVFREQPVGMTNIGETWRFSFDYRKNPLVTNGDGNSTTFAFIKIIKVSDGSFATLANVVFDSTDASDAAWASMALELLIDASFAGEVLQIGYGSYATGYLDTSRLYDNIDFGAVATPGLGSIVCLGNPTSSGEDALLTITGSDVAADNDLTLGVTGLPLNTMGYFITSQESNLVYAPGGSQGNICIASYVMGRFASSPLDSGAAGAVAFSPDLTALPSPTGTEPALAGETRFFQYWTRDTSGGTATSNFSSASGLTFQ